MSSSREDEEMKTPLDNMQAKDAEIQAPEKFKIKADYTERGLDLCHYCGLKFNVGERIPRIIVGCGHTFCTSCLSYFLRNNRIRCPMCRKLLKHCESVDKLPLNFNILYEVVTKDPLLSRVNFEKCLQADPDLYHDDEAYERDFAPYMCQKHEQRIKHFYCSEHPSIFCRECIADLHNLEACFVVDLYEIEKMRKLQQQNNEANLRQLGRRQDGATESYVIHPQSETKKAAPLQITDTQERRPRHEPASRQPTAQEAAKQAQAQASSNGNFIHQPQRYPNQPGAPIVEFDSNQFDGQGVSSQDQILAAQHHQMLLNAGQKSFPQQPFGYGLKGAEAEGEDSFSDDDEGENRGDEEESFNSELEDGGLNSAQKRKLKQDLLMMGYGRNGEFEDDNDDDLVGDIAAAQALIEKGSAAQDAAKLHQIQIMQQQQFEEAMRIQMAMKQMPLDQADPLMAQSMGLRVKNPQLGLSDEQLAHQQQELERQRAEAEHLQQQSQFEMDKKLFAQQMKEELLGKPKPAKSSPPQEEVKAAPSTIETITPQEEIKESPPQLQTIQQPDTPRDPLPHIESKKKESVSSPVVKDDEKLGKGSEDSVERVVASPVTTDKQAACAESEPVESPAMVSTESAAEGRKSLTELSQNNEESANQNPAEQVVEQPLKENAVPEQVATSEQ